MKINKIHHIGILMSGKKEVSNISKVFDLTESFRGYVPEYNSLCIFMEGEYFSSYVEFIIPDGGKLKEYIEKEGGGIHHIAFTVPDLEEAKSNLEGQDIDLLEEVPVKGAGDFLVNFVHPHFLEDIMVELIEEI